MKLKLHSPVFALLVAVAGTTPAIAQTGGLTIRVGAAEASYEALKETPIMVNVLKNGAIAQQREIRNNSSAAFHLAPGTYDVRLEGDGAITLTKRGIMVAAGQTTDIIGGPMKAGKGLRVVEYSTGGLAREEVAARLARLETAVDSLKKAGVEKRP